MWRRFNRKVSELVYQKVLSFCLFLSFLLKKKEKSFRLTWHLFTWSGTIKWCFMLRLLTSHTHTSQREGPHTHVAVVPEHAECERTRPVGGFDTCWLYRRVKGYRRVEKVKRHVSITQEKDKSSNFGKFKKNIPQDIARFLLVNRSVFAHLILASFGFLLLF